MTKGKRRGAPRKKAGEPRFSPLDGRKKGYRGGAFAKLRELPPAILEELDKRLLRGELCKDVSAWLVEQGVIEGTVPTVQRMLSRYRSTALREAALTRIAGVAFHRHLPVLVEQLDVLSELESMIAVQTGRLRKLLEQEEKLPAGIVNKSINPELRLWRDMLSDLGRLQLETGVLKRADKTFKGTVVDEGGEVRTFEWTEAQEKLFAEITEITERVHDREEP